MTKFPKVVIPAAGLGIRLRPFSEFLPKELLPLPDGKPLIHRAVEEVVEAGFREIGIVVRKNKAIIKDYFKGTPFFSRLRFLNQPVPRGIGDAISRAAPWIQGAPFLLIFPDQFIVGRRNASRVLLNQHKKNKKEVLELASRVERKHIPHFTGRPFVHGGRNWFMVGRILFPEGAIRFFTSRSLKTHSRGEDSFYPAFDALLKDMPSRVVKVSGRAYDAGTIEGYRHLWRRDF